MISMRCGPIRSPRRGAGEDHEVKTKDLKTCANRDLVPARREGSSAALGAFHEDNDVWDASPWLRGGLEAARTGDQRRRRPTSRSGAGTRQ